MHSVEKWFLSVSTKFKFVSKIVVHILTDHYFMLNGLYTLEVGQIISHFRVKTSAARRKSNGGLLERTLKSKTIAIKNFEFSRWTSELDKEAEEGEGACVSEYEEKRKVAIAIENVVGTMREYTRGCALLFVPDSLNTWKDFITLRRRSASIVSSSISRVLHAST